jgi:hypothetical protein
MFVSVSRCKGTTKSRVSQGIFPKLRWENPYHPALRRATKKVALHSAAFSNHKK